MDDKWYFAYGSNLFVDQMRDRTGIGSLGIVACLEGYRLLFNKRGADGTGKANIVQCSVGAVWGVIYKCDARVLEKLDRFEGVATGHYNRVEVVVRCTAEGLVGAIAYIAGDRFVGDSMVPSEKYLQTILSGAKFHRLPESYIGEIQRVACSGNEA